MMLQRRVGESDDAAIVIAIIEGSASTGAYPGTLGGQLRTVRGAAAEYGGRVTRVNLRALIGVTLSVVFVAFLVHSIRWHELGTSLRHANVPLLVVATVALVGFYALLALRWQLLLGASAVNIGDAFTVLNIGAFCNIVLPMRGGDMVRIFLLNQRKRLSVSYILASFVLEKLLDVTALLALAMLAVFVIDLPRWLATLLIIANVVVILGVTACFLIERRGFVRVPTIMRGLVPERLLLRLDGLLHSFHSGLHILGSFRNTLRAILLSFASWGVIALTAWLIAFALHIGRVSLAAMLIVTAVISLGQIIPSSPGAFGTYELLGVAALALFSVPREPALEFTFVLHMLSIFVQVVLGGVSMGRIGFSIRRARRLGTWTADQEVAAPGDMSTVGMTAGAHVRGRE